MRGNKTKLKAASIAAAFTLSSIQLSATDVSRLTSTMDQAYGFTENKGQVQDQNGAARPDVLFLFDNGNGFKLIAKTNSFSYELYEFESDEQPLGVEAKASSHSGFDLEEDFTAEEKSVRLLTHRIDIELKGANPHPDIVTGEALSYAKSFVKDGKQISGVKDYSQITYKNIYPNIDLVFHKSDGGVHNAKENLKYDFILHPGADISNIQLHYLGADDMELNMEGNESTLVLGTRFGTFNERIPETYTLTANGKGENIHVEYIMNNGVLGFNMDSREITETIVLDPIPERIWGTYFGGTNTRPRSLYFTSLRHDRLSEVIEGSDGHLYVIGLTFSQNGIATSGAHKQTISSFSAIYGEGVLGSYNKTNGRIRWMTYYPSPGRGVTFHSLIEAPNGNLVFPLGKLDGDGLTESYITQFNKAGNFISEEKLNIGEVVVNKILFDQQGNLVAAGTHHSLNPNSANVTSGAHQEVANDTTKTIYRGQEYIRYSNGYLAKINYPGLNLTWGTLYGGIRSEGIYDMAIDALGNIYIVGWTDSQDNIATPGAEQETLSFNHPSHYSDPDRSLSDAFMAKFDGNGVRIWGSYHGDRGNDIFTQVMIDQSNNVYVAGFTREISNQPHISTWATAGAFCKDVPSIYKPYTIQQQTYDQWITEGGMLGKFDGDGNKIWATHTKDGELYARGVGHLKAAVDPTGGLVIADVTYRISKVSTTDAFKPNISVEPPHTTYEFINGQLQIVKVSKKHDIALVRFDANGKKTWGTYFGGTVPKPEDLESQLRFTHPTHLYTDSDNRLYLLGLTTAANGIGTPGTAQPQTSHVDNADGFMVKFNCIKPTTLLAVVTGTNPSCGQNDGSVTASFTGGSGNVSYLWEDQSTNATRNSLSVGFYAVTITDANGEVAVGGIRLEAPGPKVSTDVIDAKCKGSSGGAINVNANGTGTITYSIDGGNTFSNNNTFSGLPAGSYDVVAKDNDCISPAQLAVVKEPAQILQVNAQVKQAPSCGLKNSVVDVEVTGGVEPYNVDVSGEAPALTFGAFRRFYTFQGSHVASVTDDVGCTITQIVDVLPSGNCSAAFQNPNERFDVNNDGHITANDVIIIINALNNGQAGLLPSTFDPNLFYVDVNGDGQLTAIDALQLINKLNAP